MQREEHTWETCEISWWRGYVKSDFYAAVTAADGSGTEVMSSPAFKWRSADEPPSTDSIVAAHAALVDKLVEQGWEAYDVGDAWYRRRFRRRLEGPAETY